MYIYIITHNYIYIYLYFYFGIKYYLVSVLRAESFPLEGMVDSVQVPVFMDLHLCPYEAASAAFWASDSRKAPKPRRDGPHGATLF